MRPSLSRPIALLLALCLVGDVITPAAAWSSPPSSVLSKRFETQALMARGIFGGRPAPPAIASQVIRIVDVDDLGYRDDPGHRIVQGLVAVEKTFEHLYN